MLEKILQGGPLMVPLFVCSVLTLAVVLDRALAFYENSKIDTRSLRARILSLLSDGNAEEATLLCISTPGPVSAVLMAGLQSYEKLKPAQRKPESIRAVVGNAMEEYAERAMNAVEKRFAVLSTVGNAAPLLGMTGTVTGMIASFKALSDLGGLDAGAVAGGISEALITTAAGLIIALAAVIPYNVFSAYSGKVELEIDEASSEMLDFMATRLAVEE